MPPIQASNTSSQSKKKLSKSQWVCAARTILVKQGSQSLSRRALCKSLFVTTGAFYWHYNNLEDFFDEVREDWIHQNTNIFAEIFENENYSANQMWLAYARTIILDERFDYRYDNAMRDWATTSKKTAKLVRKVDAIRINQLAKMFAQMGFDSDHSLIRARVTYFHQCGYYAMGNTESTDERLKKAPLYAEVLTGKNLYSSPEDVEAIRKQLMNI